MKYLFLLLMLMNGGYFGWNYIRPPEQQPDPQITDPGIPGLTLLRESPPPVPVASEESAQPPLLEPEPEPEPETVAAAPEVEPQPELQPEPAPEPEPPAPVEQVAKIVESLPGCYTLGPIRDQDVATELTAAIAGRGAEASLRPVDERQEVGLWVYLPALDSRDAALKLSKVLAGKGIEDYFIVSEEENENAISLGLFSREDGAQRRLKQISDLGYKPQSEMRYRDLTYYWVDYDETARVRISRNLWKSVGGGGSIIRRTPRQCGASG